jgi:membrane fusion protein (multidrug efflux system)
MSAVDSAPKKSGRARKLTIITALLLLTLLAYGAYWAKYLRHVESTDDAYVAGNVVQVTSQMAGTVVAIHADDTEQVGAGDIVIELDQSDTRIALEQATAQLAQTVREVRTLVVNNGTLKANIAMRSSELARARDDLARRRQLAGSGAVSAEEIAHAENSVQGADAALQASREQLASNRALTDNTTLAHHPNVMHAASLVESAYLNLSRTRLPAPVKGSIARRSVQVGQRVAPGLPLLAIVPLHALWVDANFKEGQIAHMRTGQAVVLRSDMYGSDIIYHGKIEGIAAGTGSAFALLPSQNASGNWIKIVQRVPVRISLDPAELARHPLRIGLSMQVEVDIKDASGTQLTASAAQRTEAAYATSVFDSAGHEADALIERVIAANAGITR